jgi:hypothetical protein
LLESSKSTFSIVTLSSSSIILLYIVILVFYNLLQQSVFDNTILIQSILYYIRVLLKFYVLVVYIVAVYKTNIIEILIYV